ncbi:MAG: hypothetical protein MK052_06610 [Alphaproteobacteria bacterium]|nr:hypothetical protein [Alphaproteobacteria bacterium]
MAESSNQNFLGKVTEFISGILEPLQKIFGGNAALEKVSVVTEQVSKANKQATDTAKQAGDLADEAGIDTSKINETTSQLGKKVRDAVGNVNLDSLRGMDRGNMAASAGGVALAAQGVASTAQNLKEGKIGKAGFAAARTAIGAVLTVAALKAHGQNESLGQFAQNVMARRSNGQKKEPSQAVGS